MSAAAGQPTKQKAGFFKSRIFQVAAAGVGTFLIYKYVDQAMFHPPVETEIVDDLMLKKGGLVRFCWKSCVREKNFRWLLSLQEMLVAVLFRPCCLHYSDSAMMAWKHAFSFHFRWRKFLIFIFSGTQTPFFTIFSRLTAFRLSAGAA